jgi:3-carboxy-cis,cis-muconate cycloisomerase
MNEQLMNSIPLAGLTGALFSTSAMREIFSASACVQSMLDFEAALAKAEAHVGVIPASAAGLIAGCCNVSRIDLAQLAAAAGPAGNLAIPLVKQLTAAVAEVDKEASKFVHWGATSQDVIDTGLVLQLRDALALIEGELASLADALADLAQRYRNTPQVGRTWMQHALPITFGLKAANWLDAVLRHQDRLSDMRPRILVLQFGGAAGTLASLGESGLPVANALADELRLGLPDTPWHTQRDRVAEVATVLGLLVGSMGKMARDISLYMQTDVAEVAEPTGNGRGGSSTMPHKRNPVSSAAVLAAATRVPALVSTMLSAMVQEQERALGGWQAEWDTLPEIVQLAGGALQQMRSAVQHLTVDTERMRINLDSTRGLVMAESVMLALGARMGRLAAHQIIEAACERASATGKHLKEVLASDPLIAAELAPEQLERLLDPATYLGQAGTFVDRVLERHTHRKDKE